MIAQIPILLLGLLIVVMGAINMTGNINSLHSYHRHRVREEDRVPFGRIVGGGTLLVGAGVIAFSVLMMIYHATEAEALVWIATAVSRTGIEPNCPPAMHFRIFRRAFARKICILLRKIAPKSIKNSFAGGCEQF